jgi:hypothetical protein
MKKIVCCIFSYDITKGMKSFGSICMLKSSKNSKELFYYNIVNIRKKIKNIFLILGFDKEKILEKAKEYKLLSKINFITNTKYTTKNQGYAFKLAIQKILYEDGKNIDGILFINNNNLIKNLPVFNKKKSWILLDKKNNKKRYQIGCFIEDYAVRHMFYDLGNIFWAEVVYFCAEDLIAINKQINNIYYDNMFMFEIINTAIEKQNIVFETLELDKTSDIIKINGAKDKLKIK